MHILSLQRIQLSRELQHIWAVRHVGGLIRSATTSVSSSDTPVFSPICTTLLLPLTGGVLIGDLQRLTGGVLIGDLQGDCRTLDPCYITHSFLVGRSRLKTLFWPPSTTATCSKPILLMMIPQSSVASMNSCRWIVERSVWVKVKLLPSVQLNLFSVDWLSYLGYPHKPEPFSGVVGA